MSFDVQGLRNALEQHGRVARVVIASHQGSSPREAGASMLVWDGGQSGTIGGGALELEAARRALEATATTVTRVPLGPALGQCCGGSVTLVTEVFERLPDVSNNYLRRVEGNATEPLEIKRAKSTRPILQRINGGGVRLARIIIIKEIGGDGGAGDHDKPPDIALRHAA